MRKPNRSSKGRNMKVRAADTPNIQTIQGNSINRILDRDTIQNPQSSIERLKVLDRNFALQMNNQESTYLENAQEALMSLHSDMQAVRTALMAHLDRGEPVSISGLIDILDGLRKWSGSIFTQASLLSGRPTSITGSLSVKCPRCAKHDSMSEAELDKEAKRLARLIESRGCHSE